MEEGASCVVIAIATNDYGCTIEGGVLQFYSKVSGGFIYKRNGKRLLRLGSKNENHILHYLMLLK